MSIEQGFLRAIIEDPDDDGHRLVYSDWLEETGLLENLDRAEFIRVQCRLARCPAGAPERPDLAKREKALLKKYAKRWAKPFHELITWWTFRRGFLDSAVVRTEGMGDRFVPLFRQLIEATPLRGICLFEQFGQPEVLLPAAPLMTRLREFGVRHGHLHEEGPVYLELLQSPHLAGLTYLDLEGPRNGTWFRPRRLSAILNSSVLSKLSTLLLSDYITDLHPSVQSAVAKSPALANLRRLSILCTSFDRNRIRAFARARFASKLETLELQHCTLAQDAWQDLLSASAFPNLQRLLLAGARIGDVEISVKGKDSEAVREQVRKRFGPDALDIEQEFPARPWYHSWSDK
jgi:uncharacterized protein (TIGR02996 family)